MATFPKLFEPQVDFRWIETFHVWNTKLQIFFFQNLPKVQNQNFWPKFTFRGFSQNFLFDEVHTFPRLTHICNFFLDFSRKFSGRIIVRLQQLLPPFHLYIRLMQNYCRHVHYLQSPDKLGQMHVKLVVPEERQVLRGDPKLNCPNPTLKSALESQSEYWRYNLQMATLCQRNQNQKFTYSCLVLWNPSLVKGVYQKSKQFGCFQNSDGFGYDLKFPVMLVENSVKGVVIPSGRSVTPSVISARWVLGSEPYPFSDSMTLSLKHFL